MWFSTERTVPLEIFNHEMSILQDNYTVHVGTTVWEASLVFAKWVEKNAETPGHPFERSLAMGKRVVELGSGCGIAAFAMALLGCDVTATDIPAVISVLKKNIKRNMVRISPAYLESYGKPSKVRCATLCWGNGKDIEAMKPPLDYVIATDVVYLEEIVHPLIQTILALSGPSTVICLGYSLRQQEAHELFWKELPKHFEVQKVDRSELSAEYCFETVDLYLLHKRTL